MTFYVFESSVCLTFEEGFFVLGDHEERWLFNGGRTIVHEAGLFLRSRQFSSYIVTIGAKATRGLRGSYSQYGTLVPAYNEYTQYKEMLVTN